MPSTASRHTRAMNRDLHPEPLPGRKPVVVPLDRHRRRAVDDGGAPWPAAGGGVSPGPASVLSLWRADEGLGDDADADRRCEHDADADVAADDAPATAVARAGDAPAALDDDALAALVARVVEHDEKALEALYDATSARVHGLALRILQRPSLAEEVVEETYWQVWRQAPRFDAARGRPMTWLLAMARTRAIDALRRDERFRHDEWPDDDGPENPDPAPPAQDLLDATRGARALHAALEALDPKARQLVALAFFRGCTHEEIAAQEAMPLGTVKSLIRRALQQLRRALEPPAAGTAAR